MVLLLAILAVLVFYVTKSVAEGYYFHAKAKAKTQYEKYQHVVLTIIRIPVWVLFLLLTENIILTAGLILIFPFIHDGLYYYTRNKLNPFVYTEGFWDDPNPKSSNAIMDFTLLQRTLLAVAGIICIVIGML